MQKQFLEENKKINGKKKVYIDVYVFGHSLDITDRDILKLFFTSDFSSVHVYAKDKVTEGKLIQNLIYIMGEDKVIEMATCYPPRLETIVME